MIDRSSPRLGVQININMPGELVPVQRRGPKPVIALSHIAQRLWRSSRRTVELEKRTVRLQACITPLLLVLNLAPASAPNKEPERYAGVTFGLEAYRYAK